MLRRHLVRCGCRYLVASLHNTGELEAFPLSYNELQREEIDNLLQMNFGHFLSPRTMGKSFCIIPYFRYKSIFNL
jgi:hypothetical protein